ncbi:amidophosphoribosyltransferase [Roseovarius faecimaris]|uniref:amidophosphoribosyltransferase n=1 Tax=Roseovarius faecimaris TaxID=2494550 RepID=UPI0012FE6E75|nr:amidophosphoribosyltransferase [Roseovarius faecimaris]
MAETTDTPADTLVAATQEGALPLHGLVLLGTFDKAEGSSALIRTRNGDIRMVQTGDNVGSSTVSAIDDGALYLVSGAHTKRLTLPEG